MSASAPPAPAPASRAPVTLAPTTHLDPGAYVRGSHGIAVGERTLIHPRAQLVAMHGPLSIGEDCIVSEKCVIGGPAPGSGEAAAKSTGDSPSLPVDGAAGAGEDDPVKTTIGAHVHIHAGSHVHAGARLQEAVVLDPHVTVLRGVTVGAHAKICAGVVVDRDVEDWAVVYGPGNVQRRRRREDRADDGPLGETMRLKAMDKEREGTTAILRLAARLTMAKKK